MTPLALDVHLGLAYSADPFLVPSFDDFLPLLQLIRCHSQWMLSRTMYSCIELVLEEAGIAVPPAYVAVLPIRPVRCLRSLFPKIL